MDSANVDLLAFGRDVRRGRGVPPPNVHNAPPVAGFWLWTLFNLAMAGLLALDIRAGRAAAKAASRDGHARGAVQRAMAWSAVWVGVALAFGGWLAIFRGASVGGTFIAGYLVEVRGALRAARRATRRPLTQPARPLLLSAPHRARRRPLRRSRSRWTTCS